MNGKIKYEFSSKIWQHDSSGGWYFAALPKDFSREIRENLKWQEEGWGRMKASAEIGTLKWDSAIWFDTKRGTYILPIKAEIRRKGNIEKDQEILINVWV